MNLILPDLYDLRHDTETMTRSRLDTLIEWRRGQVRVLHALRRGLIEMQAQKRAEKAGDAATGAARSSELTDDSEIHGCHTLWEGGFRDGTFSGADMSFLTDTEQSFLTSLLETSAFLPLLKPKKLDTLKRKIRDRIDELNQLNRADLECIRILYLDRGVRVAV